jgi:large subunit ribosomal protein L9
MVTWWRKAIKVATGLDIDRHTIATKGHIKKLGAHDVKISLGHNVVAKVSVNVVADK